METKTVDSTDDKYIAESVSTLSGELSDIEDDELIALREGWSTEDKPTEEEENEALRSARELFDLEEELRAEHYACLQVRINDWRVSMGISSPCGTY